MTAPTDAPAPARRRGGTGRDMLISLLVLMIPVALVVTLYRLRGGEDVVVVDPSAAISQARAGKLFPVAVPTGLDEGWRPISAVYSVKDGVGTLRVGYLTPDDGGVQLLETNEDPQALVPREFGRDIEPTGPLTIDGVTWRGYRIRGTELALVHTEGTRTSIVQGQATVDELRVLAGALG